MPSSEARKERRRREQENTGPFIIPASVIAALEESLDVEGDPQGGEVQLKSGKQSRHGPDTPGRSSLYETQPKSQSQPSPNPLKSRESTPKGAGTSASEHLQQRRAKNRKKRGRAESSRDSESVPKSQDVYPPDAFEKSLREIRDMPLEAAATLRKQVEDIVTRHGIPVPVKSTKDGIRGFVLPVLGSSPRIPGPDGTFRQGPPMSEEQAEALGQAIVTKVFESDLQSGSGPPDARVVKVLKTAASYPLLYSVANVDGTAQSAEVVTMEEKPSLGEQTNLNKRDSSDDRDEKIVLKEQVRPAAPSTPSSLSRPTHESRTSPDIDRVRGNSPKVSQQADINEERTDSKNPADNSATPAAQPIVLPDLSRIEGISNRLRRSIEIARDEIGPAQGAVALQRGTAYHTSSGDDNSPGDSGGKPNSGRLRRITKGGIFELKASPFRTDSGSLLEKEHRRKVSLKLPVNVSQHQLARSRTMIARPESPSLDTENDFFTSNEAEEREMEYKHRHIFIGTASLDDFLEILEVTPDHTTTRESVVKAFGILACAEQVQARQSSNSPDGWSFVARTTRDDILTGTDYLTESRVKLGSISLGKFLEQIPFNEKAETPAIGVVEVFCLSSHLDAQADHATHSKAKTFRSWLVKNKAVSEDA